MNVKIRRSRFQSLDFSEQEDPIIITLTLNHEYVATDGRVVTSLLPMTVGGNTTLEISSTQLGSMGLSFSSAMPLAM